EHPARRDLRWLTEDFVFYLPFVGASLNRLGAVRACQENAERLLSRERIIGVFPEGAKGIGKLFGDRYRLQRFGRGGFIPLSLRTGPPITPCAIVGAEEANPTVYRLESLAKLVGLPYLPVTPTFPALGPVGLLPAPSKWKMRFGAPIRLTAYGPEAADDDLLVTRLAEGVRAVIQDMLSGMLRARRSIWFGWDPQRPRAAGHRQARRRPQPRRGGTPPEDPGRAAPRPRGHARPDGHRRAGDAGGRGDEARAVPDRGGQGLRRPDRPGHGNDDPGRRRRGHGARR